MLRQLLFKEPFDLLLTNQQEILYPDIAKQRPYILPYIPLSSVRLFLQSILKFQNNRETHNPRQHFQNEPFIKISSDATEIQYQFKILENYSSDRIRFVTRVDINEQKREIESNMVQIIKQPIYCQADIITFLLIFRWFPNSMKTYKGARKTSFNLPSQKDFAKNKGKYKIQSSDLINIVFLLSQKIYVPEKYIDEFVANVADKQQIHHQHVNCLSIVVSDNQKDFFDSTNFTSTHPKTQYNQFLFDNNNQASKFDALSRSSMGSSHELARLKLNAKRSSRGDGKSPRYSERSPRGSDVRSISAETERKKKVNCNLSKSKKYFSVIELIISQVELNLEMIMFHLSEDRSNINLGYSAWTIRLFLSQWPLYNNSNALLGLNREQLLQAQVKKCLINYRTMLQLQLNSIESVSIDNIYIVLRELNSKTVTQFLDSTQQFINQPNYNDYIVQIQSQLAVLQLQLINSYAITKYELGSRVLKDLERKRRHGLDNYTFVKIVGEESINELNIGFRMYKQIVEGKLNQSFQEFVENKKQLRNRFSTALIGTNDENMLNNVENRIEICQQRKKMLENAIQLSIKQSDSLKMMIRTLDKSANLNEVNSIISETVD